MVKKIFLLVLIFISMDSFAQKKDKHNHDYYFFDDDYFYHGKPSIELSYGATNLSLKNSGVEFVNTGMMDLKLGYRYEGKYKLSKSIIRYKNNYLYGSYVSPDLGKSNQNEILEQKSWRFGAGSANGFGYALGKYTSLILYNANSIVWTRFEGNNAMLLQDSSNNATKLSNFNETFRFGTGTEAGIVIPISGLIKFQAQFDRTVVFPRHLFWKQVGSFIIESAGQTALDEFVKAIMKSSPGAGPIVSFILKNALSYGIYELRRETMNWPFSSEEPLLYNTFKAGFTFVF